MNKLEIGLTQSAMDDSEQTIQCLIEASNDIFKAGETDFEEMKSKNWYNRLWEFVTFSKDNEKKLAHGVSNLAQLQEIVTRVLLILSNKSAEIAAIVAENASSIQQLSQNQVAVIKEIEKLKYGFDRQISLADLGENKLYILVNVLGKVALETEASERGKQYVQTILKAAGFSSIDTSVEWEFIEQLDSDEMTLLYQILEEYLYLATNNFDSDSEAFEYVSLSLRKCQKIQQKIRETELIVGADFFVEYYEAENYEYTLIDELDIDFIEDDINNSDIQDETVDEYTEPEEFEISDILQIGSGETKVFKNKIMHFNSYTNCCGNLVFDHCILYYNESDYGDEISLSDEATLTISNSVIVNKGFDKSKFIKGECAKVEIKSSIFIDCSNFMELNCSEFLLTKSELKNCDDKFLNLDLYKDNANFEISHCMISTTDIAEFHRTDKEADLITIHGWSETKELTFFDNRIINETLLKKSINYLADHVGGIEVKNCTFEGLKNPIYGSQFLKCNFINCEGGIASHSLSGSIIVKNCLFEFCTDIIRTKRNSEITNCQFIACYDKLIDASWEGDVKIEFCQFVNTSWTKPTDSVYDTINGNSCISFSRDKKGYASNLNHCVFDGVETNEGFLISAPHQLYNPKAKTVAFIENCDFRNCTTKRESEKIIKEFSTYDSLFKKGQQFKAISISECKGLDKINCEKSEADVVIKKNQTASGETIGSTLTTTGKVAVGGLGYAIGGPIGLAFAVGKMGKKIIKEKTEIE